MGTLGFPELSTEQIELLCQTTEDVARKFILGKVSAKDVERLDIAVEVEGTKPVNVTVEINILLSKDHRAQDAEALVKDAIAEAHQATEIFLRQIK
jgi:GGDEF domain-containing protein